MKSGCYSLKEGKRCGRKVKCKGLCARDYMRFLRHGDPGVVKKKEPKAGCRFRGCKEPRAPFVSIRVCVPHLSEVRAEVRAKRRAEKAALERRKEEFRKAREAEKSSKVDSVPVAVNVEIVGELAEKK